MRKSVLLVLFFIISSCVYSQNINKSFVDNFYDAVAYMYEDNYDAALVLWQKIENIDRENANIWYNLGVCYKNTAKDREMAEVYLEKALEFASSDYEPNNHKIKSAPLEIYIDYGSSLRMLGKFSESIKAFEKAKEIGETFNRPELVANAEAEIIVTKNAKLSSENYVCKMITVTNLGETINSENSEHSPNIVCDGTTLFFTSKRTSVACPEGCEKIYVSRKTDEGWSTPDMLPAPINTSGKNESVVSVSSDGREMYFFRSAKGVQGSIYFTKLDENDKWTKPQLLSSDINSKYRETHITMSPDGNTIYFTSDRPGGLGGLDIYVIKKQGEKWSEPQLLPAEINTIRDEECPFVHPNGTILYFSSKGHQSLGGFDVFYSRIGEDGSYSKAESMCTPINTPDNDISYTLSCDGLTAYIAAIRKDSNGEYDIYEIKEIDDKEVIIAYEGVVQYADKKHPNNMLVWVKNVKTGEDLGPYEVDNKTGKFECSLRPKVDYELTLVKNEINYTSVSKNPTLEEAAKYKKTQVALQLDKIVLPYFNKMSNIIVTDSDELIAETVQKLDDIVTDYDDLKEEGRILNLNLVFNAEELPKKSEEITTITTYLKNKGVENKHISLNKTHKNANVYDVNVVYQKEGVLADNQSPETKSGTSESKSPSQTQPSGQNTSSTSGQQSDAKTGTSASSGTSQSGNPVTPFESANEQPTSQLGDAPIASDKEAEQITNPTYSDTLIIRPVYFEFDRYDIAEMYKSDLDKLAAYMISNPESKIEIGGHTDYVGTNEYNYLLSGRRAKSVKDYLVAKGIKQDKIITVKYGEDKPVASNNTSSMRKYNRRADFKVLIQGSDKFLKFYSEQDAVTSESSSNTGRYFIQVAALRNYKEPSQFNIPNLRVVKQSDGKYIYYVGFFKTKAEAEAVYSGIKSVCADAYITQKK